jgi:hypothetical protein
MMALPDDAVRFDETGLFYRVPDPDEEEHESFRCGESEAAQEVETYFRGAKWSGAAEFPPARCFQLLDDHGQIAGYASFGVTQQPHPVRSSRKKAPYLFLFQFGISLTHRRASPGGPRFSELALELVILTAREAETMGVYLNVREDNRQARDLYSTLGFTEDGDYRRKDGVPMLRMRREGAD